VTTTAAVDGAGSAGGAGRAGDVGLSPEQLTEVLALLGGVDTVELKLTVPDEHRRSTVASLGMDPLDAQIRQVMFFDTPDLALNGAGVVVRARRVQGREGDTVVKLRPVVPDEVPKSLRKSSSFGIEVDAMPRGFVCSASLKGTIPDADVKEVLAGTRATRKLFSKEQRAFYATHAPDGLDLDDLVLLGPINVLKLKFVSPGFPHKLVAELWNYPDGSRLLELSTKCLPREAFAVAAESKAFLASKGVDLLAVQQTKTRSALEFFAAEHADADGGSA
jgi:hypothetical protein